MMKQDGIYRAIASFLENRGTTFRGDLDNGVMLVDMISDVGSWKLHIHVTDSDEARLIAIHSQLPALIPEGKRTKVAELLTRINYDLVVGNFEMGFEDGEVSFKTTLDLVDGEITRLMFDRMYDINGQTFNQFFARILGVGFSGELKSEGGSEGRPAGELLQ